MTGANARRNPAARWVDLEAVGDSNGVCDGRRLQQLLGNLVLNAFKYGTPDAPMRVVLTGTAPPLA